MLGSTNASRYIPKRRCAQVLETYHMFVFTINYPTTAAGRSGEEVDGVLTNKCMCRSTQFTTTTTTPGGDEREQASNTTTASGSD